MLPLKIPAVQFSEKEKMQMQKYTNNLKWYDEE